MREVKKDYLIRIVRQKTSHQYRTLSMKEGWEVGANDRHSAQDYMGLFRHDVLLYAIPTVQTVANIPGGRYKDTIAPGIFHIVWRVDPRLHRGPVHGIVEAFDLEEQYVNSDSVETVAGKDGAPIDLNRWLVHDDQKLSTSPEGRTRVPWSAGCFVSPQALHAAFTAAGDAEGFMPDDWIPARLIEV